MLVPLITVRCLFVMKCFHPKQIWFLCLISFGIMPSCFWEIYRAWNEVIFRKQAIYGLKYCFVKNSYIHNFNKHKPLLSEECGWNSISAAYIGGSRFPGKHRKSFPFLATAFYYRSVCVADILRQITMRSTIRSFCEQR